MRVEEPRVGKALFALGLSLPPDLRGVALVDSELASKVGMYTILTHPPPRATEGFAIPTIPVSPLYPLNQEPG